jgi:hypothetical protein
MTKIEILKEQMKKGIVTFSYLKNDGSVRVAHGTTNLTAAGVTHQFTGEPSKVKGAGYTSYYDTDKKGWRCFAESRLL